LMVAPDVARAMPRSIVLHGLEAAPHVSASSPDEALTYTSARRPLPIRSVSSDAVALKWPSASELAMSDAVSKPGSARRTRPPGSFLNPSLMIRGLKSKDLVTSDGLTPTAEGLLRRCMRKAVPGGTNDSCRNGMHSVDRRVSMLCGWPFGQ